MSPLIGYFVASGVLILGLQALRYPMVDSDGVWPMCPKPLWYAFFSWFFIFSLVQVGGLGALLYAVLLPFIAKHALQAFSPRLIAPHALKIGWISAAIGTLLSGVVLVS